MRCLARMIRHKWTYRARVSFLPGTVDWLHSMILEIENDMRQSNLSSASQLTLADNVSGLFHNELVLVHLFVIFTLLFGPFGRRGRHH